MEPEAVDLIQESDIIPEEDQLPPGLPRNILDELAMRRDIQKYLRGVQQKMHSGEIAKGQLTMAELADGMDEIARKYGHESGLPVPSLHDVNRPLILARGAPLSNFPPGFETLLEYQSELERGGVHVRNSWSMLGDKEVCVVETEQGPMALPRYHAGGRLRKLLDAAMMRSQTQQTAAAEFRAMESLKQRIGEHRWEGYVLNGCFAEQSERSGIHYIFRKGLPTIAVSYHEGFHSGHDTGRVIACLCLHPLGYYAFTTVGLLCPTDEIICALLMMRGDEWKFWQSSGQWSASDPRSGI